jgi:hypothetical protein
VSDATRYLGLSQKLYSAVERAGRYAEIQILVTVLVPDSVAASDTLFELALGHADMPKTGELYEQDDDRFADLYLEERHPALARTYQGPTEGGSVIEVRLIYRRHRASMKLPLRGSAGLSAITTNFDQDGKLIIPTYKKDGVAQPRPRNAPALHVTIPVSTSSYEFAFNTDEPDELAGRYVNHVNDDNWHGFPAGTALITAMDYELLDETCRPAKYLFRVSVSVREAGLVPPGIICGWNPFAVYVDANGTPPADVKWGNGIEECKWYHECNFANLFNDIPTI